MGIFSAVQDLFSYMFVRNVATGTYVGPNLGEDIRLVVNSPEFEKQVNEATPLLLAALVAWPSFWIYRGLVWHSVRDVEPLPLYIKKTFYCSKILELTIILTGIAVTLSSKRKTLTKQQEQQDNLMKK